MRQVTITLKRTYVETVEHTIQVPDHIKDSEVDDWLYSNPDLYQDEIEETSLGVGVWEKDDFRYDVEEVITTKKHLYGGSF